MARRWKTSRKVVHTRKIVQHKALGGGGVGRVVAFGTLGIAHSSSVRRAIILPEAVVETS